MTESFAATENQWTEEASLLENCQLMLTVFVSTYSVCIYATETQALANDWMDGTTAAVAAIVDQRLVVSDGTNDSDIQHVLQVSLCGN